MNVRGKDIKLFAGNSNKLLAEAIARELGTELGKCKVKTFMDGEISISIEESVRGMDCFIIQSTRNPVNNNLMELLIMADALRRASATRVTAVMPYYGYARQDRKAKGRDPISAKVVADMISAVGIDRMMTMDLHAQQIQGFFNIPVDHLVGAPVLVNYFQKLIAGHEDEYVCLSPDVGSVGRVRTFAGKLHDCPIAIVDKRRQVANQCEVMHLIGDVKGKNVLLIDDIVDTAGTLCHAAQAAIDQGALSVRAAATHAVLSGNAIENIRNAPFEEVIFLDTISIPEDKRLPNFRILSTADYIAHAISCVHNDESMSDMINGMYIDPELFD